MRTWLTALTAATVVASGFGAAPAAHAAESDAALRLAYGDSPESTSRHWSVPTPETGLLRNPSPGFFTVTNTGTQTLEITTVTFDGTAATPTCQDGTAVPAGGYATCWFSLPMPAGRPGTSRPFALDVAATTGGTTVTDRLTGEWRFYDVVPKADVTLRTDATGDVQPSTPVRYRVLAAPVPDRSAPPKISGITSSRFGDLLDRTNPAVTDNTCADITFYRECTYTAAAPATSGAFTETVTLQVTDGTGPNGTSSSSVTLTVAAPTARTAAQWADPAVVWPSVRAGQTRTTRDTSTAATFPLPKPCRRVVPATLGQLAAADVPDTGRCRREWALVTEATAALLNEATLGEAYPAANTDAIYWDTFRALAGTPRAVTRVTTTLRTWNGS